MSGKLSEFIVKYIMPNVYERLALMLITLFNARKHGTNFVEDIFFCTYIYKYNFLYFVVVHAVWPLNGDNYSNTLVHFPFSYLQDINKLH